MLLEGMPERSSEMQDIPVPPPLPLPLDDPFALQIGENEQHRSLGDTNCARYIPDPGARILMERDQDVGVVTQECPCARTSPPVLA
jgi:hypothetical protein